MLAVAGAQFCACGASKQQSLLAALGAPLARMEMQIALPALLRRFPTLAPAEDFEDVAFRSFHFIYGLKSLEVNW